MRTRTIGITMAGLVALASCVQDQPTPPASPTAPAFGRSVGSCPVTTVSQDAKAYFADNQDAVFALLDTLQSQSAISAAAATPVGYRILSRLAVVANTAYGSGSLAKGDSTAGSKFANDVLGCMSVTGYSASAPVDFSGALGTTGLFAVRSDSKLDAVISRATNADAEPLFGAERSQSGSWYAHLGSSTSLYTDPILFYGYRLPPAPTFGGEDTASVTYDLSTLPTPLAFTKDSTVNGFTVTLGTLRTGVCDVSSDSAQILHEHGSDAILPPEGTPAFCAAPPDLNLGMTLTPRMRLASAAHAVASWFTPQPLYAFVTRGGGSALVSGLSHLGAVKFNVDPNSGVTFYQQPLSGKLGAPDQFPKDIAVQVLSVNNSALANVKVSLTVVGNSGSFTPPADSVRFTNSQGIATFPNFTLDKAGGYTITAHTAYGQAVSDLFNLTGKGK